jgi:hypothetical protein
MKDREKEEGKKGMKRMKSYKDKDTDKVSSIKFRCSGKREVKQ